MKQELYRRGRSCSFQKQFAPKFWSMGLASRARQNWSKNRKHPNFASPPKAKPSPQSKFFFNRTKKTFRIRRGFEHLSSCIGWRVITKKPWATIVALVVVKGYSAVDYSAVFYSCSPADPAHFTFSLLLSYIP